MSLPKLFLSYKSRYTLAESTHLEIWPKQPTYQGRNDPPLKLAETTQTETTQAETTQGRNDPDSVCQCIHHFCIIGWLPADKNQYWKNR